MFSKISRVIKTIFFILKPTRCYKVDMSVIREDVTYMLRALSRPNNLALNECLCSKPPRTLPGGGKEFAMSHFTDSTFDQIHADTVAGLKVISRTCFERNKPIDSLFLLISTHVSWSGDSKFIVVPVLGVGSIINEYIIYGGGKPAVAHLSTAAAVIVSRLSLMAEFRDAIEAPDGEDVAIAHDVIESLATARRLKVRLANFADISKHVKPDMLLPISVSKTAINLQLNNLDRS